MKFRFVGVITFALALGIPAGAQETPSPTPSPSPQGQAPGPGSGMGRGQERSYGGWMGGRGVVGTVTEVGTDHYTVKSEFGESYTVHFSVNTRVMKQPAQRLGADGMRTPPQELKTSDIRVGDVVMAQGEVDATAKSVGAVLVVKVDPARAQQMREMQANFGKTWLMGKVTAVNETKVTLQSPVDNNEHTFVADENTSFRRRREPVTLADVTVGENVRVEGSVKDGVFTASSVAVMAPPVTGGPAQREGPPPQ